MKLDKEDIVTFLREKKTTLKNRFDVDEIKLFGSFARNEQTEKSDIDLLVEFGNPSYDKLYYLKVWLEQKFNRECDLVRVRKNIKKRFLDRIEKESLSV